MVEVVMRMLAVLGIGVVTLSAVVILAILASAPAGSLNKDGSLSVWGWIYLSTAGIALGAGLVAYAARAAGWLAEPDDSAEKEKETPRANVVRFPGPGARPRPIEPVDGAAATARRLTIVGGQDREVEAPVHDLAERRRRRSGEPRPHSAGKI